MKKIFKLETKSYRFQQKALKGEKKLLVLNEALSVSEILDRISKETGMSRSEVMKKEPNRFYDALKHADELTLSDLMNLFDDEQKMCIYALIDDLIDDDLETKEE